MVGDPNLKARTETNSTLVTPLLATKNEQLESGYGSTNSASDDLSGYRRTNTAKSRKQPHHTPIPMVDINRSKNILHGTYQCDSTERNNTKQQQLQPFNLDPINNYHRLKTANSQISIDATPFQKFIPNNKIYNNGNSKKLCSKPTNTSTEHSRKLHTPVKKDNDIVNYSDDWDSDYSDDWESEADEKPKITTAIKLPSKEPKIPDNSLNLIPSDPTAFEASFCRKRQAAIDNMSYRQAVDSWKAKGLHDVAKLINELSSGKNLIDRAWIVFYWVSQNIEYDVEAYFSGNIHHQTAADIFASRKGVCDAFGTIFETLCTAVQIECKKISGYAKGYSFKMGQKSFTRTNHAWNVLRLEGHWYLVDSTWGAGHLDSNNQNQKELNSFYFLVPPEQMIYRHLPEDSQWQLLISSISMDDFIHMPYVHPAFFEHNLDIVSPRHSNTAFFNLNHGLSEVLVRAPSDVTLMGDIKESGSGKIETSSLIQYDTDRQLWQCLFAPKRSGSHTLTIFTRREIETIKSKNTENKYSCAIEFSLHVPSDVVKIKPFPLTYGLYTQCKCQIFEPLDGALKSGSITTIHCRIPNAYCARLQLDGKWLSEDILKDGIFKRQITIPQREITMYVKFPDKKNSSSYNGLFHYSIK
ncbi:unnamed protein product [Adineta steineri]|uniref:Transglutaminase-like domain-containing protein n=1 Tax=Adineta steineri TaxID=433720 RepID=A0A815P5N3_9BILA|nr:unnamed protein product [Adineta steineri]CAF1628798.1 unnamed protein product [Adineta steineri]